MPFTLFTSLTRYIVASSRVIVPDLLELARAFLLKFAHDFAREFDYKSDVRNRLNHHVRCVRCADHLGQSLQADELEFSQRPVIGCHVSNG